MTLTARSIMNRLACVWQHNFLRGNCRFPLELLVLIIGHGRQSLHFRETSSCTNSLQTALVAHVASQCVKACSMVYQLLWQPHQSSMHDLGTTHQVKLYACQCSR